MSSRGALNSRGWVVGAVVAAAVVVGLFFWFLRRAEEARRLPVPGYLPPTARALLDSQMQLHGHQMAELGWRVVRLDYRGVAELARDLAAGSMLARPIEPDATQLNAALPVQFFELQDELKASARELAEAAGRNDGRRLASAYSNLSRTCVACHLVYLEPAGSTAGTQRDGAAAGDAGTRSDVDASQPAVLPP